jgi:branched-subunit amino acid aminotransferase/4-amino-4-deoxychorismate lyase
MTTPQHESNSPHPIISLNGCIVSPLDRGFTLGDGLFETIKVTNGIVWYLDRHLDRLSYGAAKLGIVVPIHLRRWINEVVQHTGIISRSCYAVRVILTRGIADIPQLAGYGLLNPTVTITTLELPQIQQELYKRGLRAHVSSMRRYEMGATVGIKTINYLESVLALREAITAGYDEAIFLDTRGFVSEASASNIFLCYDGQLMTPSHTCGILPGITRAVVLELAAQAGIPAVEREIPTDYLYRAEELFLTSSLRDIIPVTRVNDCHVGIGVPGLITQRLTSYYNAVIERI